MIGLLRRCPIDRDIADWLVESFTWLEAETAELFDDNRFPLVTPTAGFFPASGLEGHAKALRLFETVKGLMGLSEWPCELESLDEDVDGRVSDIMFVKNTPSSPGGTFSSDGKIVNITYNPAQLREPVSLIATFAHECSHYFLHGAGLDLPEGIEEELLTDLCAVFFGFGLFHCNSAFAFQRTNDGWSSRRMGYLSGPSFAFALAQHVLWTGTDPETALKHIKPELASVFKKSLRYLNKSR